MSSNPIQATSNSSPTLPTLSMRGHGHAKGVHAGAQSDPATTNSTEAPIGSTQNLFGSLMDSFEQLIGAQPAGTTTSTQKT